MLDNSNKIPGSQRTKTQFSDHRKWVRASSCNGVIKTHGVAPHRFQNSETVLSVITKNLDAIKRFNQSPIVLRSEQTV